MLPNLLFLNLIPFFIIILIISINSLMTSPSFYITSYSTPITLFSTSISILYPTYTTPLTHLHILYYHSCTISIEIMSYPYSLASSTYSIQLTIYS